MIQKAAKTGLTKALALNRFNEASAMPGAVVEMFEQEDGMWTVTVVWDDDGDPVSFADLAAFDETAGKAKPAEAPVPKPAPVLAPAQAPAAAVMAPNAGAEELGNLSRRFESNGRPGAIGFDSTGGYSYGAYQIATKTGTMKTFLAFLGTDWPDLGAPLKNAGGEPAALAGTAEFRTAWQSLAGDASFLKAQHAFIAKTHYEPFKKSLNALPLTLDLSARTPVLRDVAWSVAVQHGANNKVFHNALGNHPAGVQTDRQIIEKVYAERSNVVRYFPNSTEKIQRAVVARFLEELSVALSRLPP